ncbi:peroxiredoxin [Antrihabitans sp. YC2-6]|uniref:peroxiredoxin n=1 Tax=Antrihabitans sp. YC2-6 TaxID=2799498 RepID=UPI0018F6E9E9|nr:peroxiredoxin [Antrihabitans sp. YC2-6]MBJ8345606.1 peroxiredoxin [Antrihabitans sp. YC2-6]
MNEGDQAPNFYLFDHTGTRRSLYAFLSDGPVVLFFYPIANSPICSAEACHFRDLASEFAAVHAQRVGISTDTVDRQAHFAQQRAFDYPLLSDEHGAVAEQFGVKRGIRRARAKQTQRHRRRNKRPGLFARLVPTKRKTFVIDVDGTVLKVVSSELRGSIHANQALWYLQTQYPTLRR